MIIANWKMNLTLDQAIKNCKILSKSKESTNLLISPSTAYIAYLKKNYSKLNFCAQDVSLKADFGAYTGENSAKLFKELGLSHSIVGHSERRNNFNETNDQVKIKAINCIENNIVPIICVGETLQQRKNNSYKDFLAKQLSAFSGLNYLKTIIAYEPLWSIGKNITASAAEIAEIAALFKNLDSKSQLLYGGSVNSKNCREILAIEGISGLLVGSASLDAEELLKILTFY